MTKGTEHTISESMKIKTIHFFCFFLWFGLTSADKDIIMNAIFCLKRL